MRYILRNLYLLLLLMGMVACSKDKVGTSADEDGSNMLRLNITVQPSQQNSSRTPVVEPDDDMLGAKHHVSYVKLYVINDNETSSVDYQNILLTKPFVWDQYSSETQQNGYDTHSMTVEIDLSQYASLQKLRIIAIGLDATDIADLEKPSGNSADAYLYDSSGKFDNIAKGTSLFYDETSKTSINPIPRSEFYAGCSVSFSPSEVTGKGKSGIEVILNRRVAGFVGYFKDIPENVKYIGIGSGHIGKSFQTSLPILSKEQLEIEDESNLNKNWSGAEEGYLPIEMPSLFDDMIFVSVNDESQVEQQLKARNGSGAVGTGEKNPDPELVVKGETTKIMGFMPPMTINVADYGENTSTLMLNLYGEKDTDSKYPLIKSVKVLLESSVYPEQGSRAGTGIIEDEGDRDLKYQYPIRANEIYRIGTKDNPISLDGSVSYVTVRIDEAWDEYYGGSMNGNAQDGIGIDTEWGDHPAGEIGTSSD
ncbi:hypothetical protein I6E18_14800 [Phocaeicola barnesiae]|uniref:hypothetical protein n=1 Tax=Phocaeicola barnesiae TaxID=376804 RepID=UPI001F347B04|nr:hypothetical protein [Phocaeicola barnesiae]MCF2577400.1 hypothetical protein [Phocaeicola barnesiae]